MILLLLIGIGLAGLSCALLARKTTENRSPAVATPFVTGFQDVAATPGPDSKIKSA